MASAAAVAANQARSPSPLTKSTTTAIGQDKGLPGEITSGVYSKDEGIPDIDGNVVDEDEEEDEDLPSNPLQGRKKHRPPVNGDAEDGKAGVEDLFGDDEEEPERPARRQLDDEELDSGDDVDRRDRAAEEEGIEPEQQEYNEQEKVVMEMEMPRQAGPEPSDGEMYLLKLPTFMAIQPSAWDHQTFQPPTTDHHSKRAPSQTFSAYNTALSSIRWRHSPSSSSNSSSQTQTQTLQSNARIHRWSDGSLTLQLASEPATHYEIDGNGLAPPQRNPLKPTPTSMKTTGAKAGYKQAKGPPDAYTYLTRPDEGTGSMLVTHKITAGLSIKPSGTTADDDAIERLQASLAAASNVHKVNGGDGGGVVQIDEDPEKGREDALRAVRQIEKADKKRDAAIEREAAKGAKALGRSGASRYNQNGGLNVGMLEDEEGEGRVRPGQNKGARGQQRRRRRNSEYSEDEDFGRKRFSREDEYEDEGDDFLAPSDEEEDEEEGDDDEDPDDGIVEEARHKDKGRDKGRERTPKRSAQDLMEDDDEADAPGEEEDEAEVQAAANRTKRRRVVDEDEDEE